MKFDLYTADGSKNGTIDAPSDLFERKINVDLMHRSVVMRLANRRTPIAHTLTRAEVSMTTAKSYKQKGTGRARRGAKSTSLLRGGGVSHGPRNNRNYSKDMPKKERRAALFSALSVLARDNNIFALENFLSETPKTANFARLLAKLPEAKKILFVLPEANMIFEKSASNIPNVNIITANFLNPYDLLNADKVCFVSGAIDKATETFLK